MRSRLVIPAALLVAAAYVKGRQDASLFAPASRSAAPAPQPQPGPTAEAILRAEAEAADAWELGLAEAQLAATAAPLEPIAYVEPVQADRIDDDDEPQVLSEWSAAPVAIVRAPTAPPEDPALLNEWFSPPAAPAAEEVAPVNSETPAPEIDESGRFSLGGFADQPGHMALCGVTFHRRLDGAVDAGRIRLIIEAAHNVAGEGLVVLSDEGFAPDREGFTLLLAAGAPGAFAASGRYVVLP